MKYRFTLAPKKLAHSPAETAPLVTTLQRPPSGLAILLLTTHWLWLSCRYRSITLPSTVNPAITTGGLAGEGRLEYFSLTGSQAQPWIATTTWIPCGGPDSADDAEGAMRANGMAYPVVLKPDVASGGTGACRIDTRAGLLDYLAQFPRGERIVIQEFIAAKGTASLFYLRRPTEWRGRITDVLLHRDPAWCDDEKKTAATSSDAMPTDESMSVAGTSIDALRSNASLAEASAPWAGLKRAACRYDDASDLISPSMNDAIDKVALEMTDFHVGRFTVCYESLAELRAGRGFKVIDIGGASASVAESGRLFLALRQTYRVMLDQQAALFEMGDAMRRRGIRPIGLLELARYYLNRRALMRLYPPAN